LVPGRDGALVPGRDGALVPGEQEGGGWYNGGTTRRDTSSSNYSSTVSPARINPIINFSVYYGSDNTYGARVRHVRTTCHLHLL